MCISVLPCCKIKRTEFMKNIMTTFRNGAYIPGTTQNFVTSGASQYSSPVGSKTGIIRVAVNQDTFIAVGSGNPTANTSCMLMPAGRVDFFATDEGGTQVAFIKSATSGNISITELV